MEEIKFRGKRTHDGKWIYGNLVIDSTGNKHIIPFDVVEEDGHHLLIDSDEPVFFDQDTIGQYIGIKDKNNIEIYEDDIVFCNGRKYNYLVHYSGCGFLAYAKVIKNYQGEKYTDFVDARLTVDKWEIKGSRHENYGMLEGN